MNDKLYIEIVTPYGMFYEAQADQIVLPALDGEIGIRPGHSPITVALKPGEVRITNNEETIFAALGNGFAQIEVDNVIVVVGSAEYPEQINVDRASLALYRAEQRLKEKSISPKVRERSEQGIMRSKARIKVSGKYNSDKKEETVESHFKIKESV